MATATLTATVDPTKTDVTERHELYFGSVAVSAAADTYATDGIVLSFAKGEIKSSQVPIDVTVKGIKGFVYAYVPGTTIANGKVKIFTGAAAQANLTEFTNGVALNNTGEDVSADTISFVARFRKIL